MNTQQHENWLRKRKHTFLAFNVQIAFMGIEYSLTFITLWLYIKEMIRTDTPKLYYSVISVSYLLASCILTPFIGRVVDKNRNIKFCILIFNLLMITGNVVYSLHFSPFLLIFGRLICGFLETLQSIIFSETIRSYPAPETSLKLSILSVMFNLGLVLGPCINFFFKDINIFVGNWHLKNVNFPGLFMGFVYIIMEIIAITMVHDVSKEFDYKAYVEGGLTANKNDTVCSIKTNEKLSTSSSFVSRYGTIENETELLLLESNKYTAITVFKILLLNFDSALLLFADFFLAFFALNTDIWLPLLIIEKLNLSITEINICSFGSNGISAIVLLLFIWRPFSQKQMVTLLVTTFGCFCALSACFIILSNFRHSKLLNILFSIVYILSFGGIRIILEVFFVNTLASMVSSKVQTYVDSIRSSIFTAGGLLAFVSSPFMFDYIEIFGTMYIVVMMVLGILFIIRKKYYIYPKLLC